jgi:parvulin-like peptidyl-prolyl isomerase
MTSLIPAAVLPLLLAAATPAAPPIAALDPAASALIAADAERNGLAARPEIAEQLEAAHSAIAVEQLLAENAAAPAPTAAEVRAEFRATAHGARLQMIARATRADAEAALARLRRGASLADEAKQSVEAVTREAGGELGWIVRGEIPAAVATDAFQGALGTWRGPYDLGGRWALVRTVERKTPKEDKKSLDAVRARMVAERRVKARDAYTARLRERAKVTLDEPFIMTAAARTDLSQADQERVIATVAGRQLRYRELAAASSSIKSAHGGARGTAAMQLEAGRQLVDRLLLEDEARRKYPAGSPALAKRLRPARQEILVAASYDEFASKLPSPTKQEVEARYQARKAEYVAPASRRCAHAVVGAEDGAKALRKRVAAGEKFDALAREASADQGSRDKGGDIGEVTDERLGRMDPALATAIRKLPAGHVSDPVKTRMGWHLVRCEPIPARQKHLVEVEDRIAGTLRHERTLAAMTARAAELKGAAPKAADKKAAK